MIRRPHMAPMRFRKPAAKMAALQGGQLQMVPAIGFSRQQAMIEEKGDNTPNKPLKTDERMKREAKTQETLKSEGDFRDVVENKELFWAAFGESRDVHENKRDDIIFRSINDILFKIIRLANEPYGEIPSLSGFPRGTRDIHENKRDKGRFRRTTYILLKIRCLA